MTPQAALAAIEESGGRIILDHGQPILIPAPDVAPPAEAVAILRQHRTEIVGILEERATAWRPRLTVLADVQPERVTWLWPGRIAFGKVGVFDGDPGDGKSTIMTDIAARASVGQPMPDGTYGDVSGPINTLLMSAEDGVADTIRPRLDAAGGDATRVAVLECKVQDDGEAAVSLADLPLIRAALVTSGAKMLVIDPVMAYLPSASNSYRDQDVRGILAPLARLAEELGVAIVIVRHFSKTGGANAIYRGGGSIGFIGQARIGLMVGRDPEDDTGQRRILAVTKSNLAAFPPALAYHLEEAENGVARVVWEGVTEHTASMLLAVPQQSTGEDERTERDEAADALRTALAKGRRTQKDVMREVREATGASERTVHRARQKLGVRSEREGFGAGSIVYWRLPDIWDGEGAIPYLPHTLHTCQPPEGGKYDKYVASMGDDPKTAESIDTRVFDTFPDEVTPLPVVRARQQIAQYRTDFPTIRPDALPTVLRGWLERDGFDAATIEAALRSEIEPLAQSAD